MHKQAEKAAEAFNPIVYQFQNDSVYLRKMFMNPRLTFVMNAFGAVSQYVT